MKIRLTLLFVAFVSLVVWLPEPAAAQEDKSFELALFSPVQARSEDDAIRIFRFSLLFGRNVSVKGLDVGLVARSTGGVSKGLQYSVVGIVDGDFVGWQANGVSITNGAFTGYQTGIFNKVGDGEGFQLGLVNRAHNMGGLQVGLVNVADNMYGVQVGLINVIRSKENLVFLPIVNWSF